MTTGTRSRLEVLRDALRHRELRRLAAVFVAFEAAEAGAWIAVTTVAHQRGGVREASVVLVVQLAPAALGALAVGHSVARWGSRAVLVGGLATQAVAMALLTVLVPSDAPGVVLYTPAVVASVAMVVVRPTLSAALPLVVVDPHELTAANAAVGWLDGVAVLVGPLVASAGFALGGLGTPFAIFAVVTAVTAAGAASLTPAPVRSVAAAAPAEGATTRRQRRVPGVRPALAVLAAFGLALGALDLLFVVVAVDVTDGGPARAAWFAAAFGLGSIAGGAAAILLVGRRLLWPAIAITGTIGVASLAVVGLGGIPLAVAALAVCGAAISSVLVATRTVLQRLADLDALCRVFSLAEASDMAMLLAGAVVVPAFVTLLDERTAPAGVAMVVGLVTLLAVASLRRAEAEVAPAVERIPVLRSSDLFSLLAAPAIETLARSATERMVDRGTVVVRQGEAGDEFFVLAEGAARVDRDGEFVIRLGPGDGFGELALLLDGGRRATVTAEAPSRLLVIDRRSFLTAVTSSSEVDEVVRATASRLSAG